MSKSRLRPGSLVLYKQDPARVAAVDKKIQIELPGGERLSVRPKDVILLHSGPAPDPDTLQPETGEVKTAWELLSGGMTSLAELAELAYGAFTPSTAWAAWQFVADGLYFHGTPEEIVAHSPEAVAREEADRAARAAERQAWAEFLDRIRAKEFAPGDEDYLRDVERLALGQTESSRVLEELKRSETPENAHALLLELGYWDHTIIPYPHRLNLPTTPPTLSLLDLPVEDRVDMTHLPAFAIDDAGNQDPDDAVSLEMTPRGRRLWVHIADAAALVPPNHPADLEARSRGATLYLPDGNVPMLPHQAVHMLGMGLQETSPALSFGIDLDDVGHIRDVEIVPSWVRVKRMTYAEAEAVIEESPLAPLYQVAQAYQARRQAHDAIDLRLPEVNVYVQPDGEVVIRPILLLRSRVLVQEAMLMAGEATARFALERDIPLPFATQAPPDTDDRPAENDLAGMYALRRHLNRSQYSTVPASHTGLGLSVYVRTTSPLRRYMDLVVHQQLRAHWHNEKLLHTQDVIERIGAIESVTYGVRRAERLARQHWTLVYLSQNPGWRGEGILVDQYRDRGTVLIPELDLEPQLHLPEDLPLNSTVTLTVTEVNLAALEVYFRIVDDE